MSEMVPTTYAYATLQERLDSEHEGGELVGILPEQVAAFMATKDDDMPLPKLNLELLRETITWARKSHEVEEERPIDWQQSVWAKTTLPVDVEVTKYVDDNDEEFYLIPAVAVRENFCNTAGCIAGNIALQNGEPLWYHEGTGFDGKKLFGATNMKTGESIDDFAAEQLGLCWIEQEMLFDGDNTIDEVELIAEAIAIRRGLRL